jgi:hypothetical protein
VRGKQLGDRHVELEQQGGDGDGAQRRAGGGRDQHQAHDDTAKHCARFSCKAREEALFCNRMVFCIVRARLQPAAAERSRCATSLRLEASSGGRQEIVRYQTAVVKAKRHKRKGRERRRVACPQGLHAPPPTSCCCCCCCCCCGCYCLLLPQKNLAGKSHLAMRFQGIRPCDTHIAIANV